MDSGPERQGQLRAGRGVAREAHDAWVALLSSAKQDALTDELAEAGSGEGGDAAREAAREAVVARQLDALLPGRRAVLIGLEAHAPRRTPHAARPAPHATWAQGFISPAVYSGA